MPSELIAGRYRLDERLGASPMAEVWSAWDEELGRRVAVKLLSVGGDPARFEREARAAAALSHPNVVGVYDVGTSDGRRFIVQEYVPGGTLEDRLRAGRPLPDDEAAAIATDIAAGLAHAHVHGLVHRDLKPANVLFDEEGRAKIADFGIARFADEPTLTEAGTILGTAAYLSPEQAAGEPATPASDVYSAGVILYRMRSGRLPFEAAHPLEVARKHVEEEPPPLDDRSPLAGVAMAALAKDPYERPQDGAARQAALLEPRHAFDAEDETVAIGAVAEGETVPLTAATRWGRWRIPLIALALVALGLGGLAIAQTASNDDSSPPPPPSPLPPPAQPPPASPPGPPP